MPNTPRQKPVARRGSSQASAVKTRSPQSLAVTEAPADRSDSSQPLGGGEPSRLRVEVLLRTKNPQARLSRWLKPRLAQVCREAGVCKGTICVVVVDDPEMIQLHQTYKNSPETTDVLTYDLRDDPADPHQPMEADIVINIDQALRQATALGHDVRLEVLLYAVHGLVHLLGGQDSDPIQAAQMHRHEDQLLQAIGVGPVYYHRKPIPQAHRG